MIGYQQSIDAALGARTEPVRAFFIPLEHERRTHIDTASAAYHLGRKPQTLRAWASTEQGPIRPVRINGRLAWPVERLRVLLLSSL